MKAAKKVTVQGAAPRKPAQGSAHNPLCKPGIESNWQFQIPLHGRHFSFTEGCCRHAGQHFSQ